MKCLKKTIILYVLLISVSGCQTVEKDNNTEINSSKNYEVDDEFEKLVGDYRQLLADFDELNNQIDIINSKHQIEIDSLNELVTSLKSEVDELSSIEDENIFNETFWIRRVKYFFGWIELTTQKPIYVLPDENSSVLYISEPSKVWVYDSIRDENFDTWLLITTSTIHDPIIGYIRADNSMNKIYEFENMDERDKSVESINTIHLGDKIDEFDKIYKGEYALFDSSIGKGRIYPLKYDVNNSDNDWDSNILILTNNLDEILQISISIPDFYLSSGIGIGDSIDEVEKKYEDYEKERGAGYIAVTIGEHEIISFRYDYKNEITMITLRASSGPPF